MFTPRSSEPGVADGGAFSQALSSARRRRLSGAA